MLKLRVGRYFHSAAANWPRSLTGLSTGAEESGQRRLPTNVLAAALSGALRDPLETQVTTVGRPDPVVCLHRCVFVRPRRNLMSFERVLFFLVHV